MAPKATALTVRLWGNGTHGGNCTHTVVRLRHAPPAIGLRGQLLSHYGLQRLLHRSWLILVHTTSTTPMTTTTAPSLRTIPNLVITVMTKPRFVTTFSSFSSSFCHAFEIQMAERGGLAPHTTKVPTAFKAAPVRLSGSRSKMVLNKIWIIS